MIPQAELSKKIENFPRLTDQECALIIRENLIEALESDTYVDWDIVTKFMLTSYADRKALCQLFGSAARKNAQKIGTFTIGEWIRKYQDQYLNKERNPNTFFEFVSNNPEVRQLPKRNHLMIARILRMYDYLFIIPIDGLDGPVSNILRFAMRSEATPEELSARIQPSSVPSREVVQQQTQPISMSLADAMKQFPELGEQAITANRIKIMSFPEPVRPSIKNWIADYTYDLGRETHSAIVRSNYLFHSKNAQGLSSSDRANLSYVLKAFDEKSVVAVDKVGKKIIFGESDSKVQPLENAQAPSRLNLETRNASDQQSTTNKISFSSPQKLAYERKDVSQDQPYRIVPTSQTRPQAVENKPDPRTLGKNVVNLREQ